MPVNLVIKSSTQTYSVTKLWLRNTCIPSSSEGSSHTLAFVLVKSAVLSPFKTFAAAFVFLLPLTSYFGLDTGEADASQRSAPTAVRSSKSTLHPTHFQRCSSDMHASAVVHMPAQKSTTTSPGVLNFCTRSIIRNLLLCSGLHIVQFSALAEPSFRYSTSSLGSCGSFSINLAQPGRGDGDLPVTLYSIVSRELFYVRSFL